MAANVKGFGCRPVTDVAASTEVGGRRPKASKEGNRGTWDWVSAALWGFEHDRRGRRRQRGPPIALIGDVAACAGVVAGAGIRVERGRQVDAGIANAHLSKRCRGGATTNERDQYLESVT